MSKSITIQFVIPEDMETEDITTAVTVGLEHMDFVDKNSKVFQAEVIEVILRDRLVIIKERK